MHCSRVRFKLHRLATFVMQVCARRVFVRYASGKNRRGHKPSADIPVYPRMVYVRGLVSSLLNEMFVPCRKGGQK